MITWRSRSAIRAMSFTLTLLVPCLAFADTPSTVEAYFAQLAGSHRVLEESLATVRTSSGERIFGIACWELEAAIPEDHRSAEATVFILERTGTGLKELVRSKAFAFPAKFQRYLELAVEASSKHRFRVTVLLQSRGIGFVEYRFVERRNAWYLAGLESSRASIHMEEGDEAVGDTRTEQSTNFFTGRSITKRFQANRLASVERKKKIFPTFPLEEFEIFDPRHDE